MKPILPIFALVISLLAACDDTTGMAGTEVMPSGDKVTTSSAIFSTTTRSVPAGRVLISTAHSYLGCIIDPETSAMTRSSFLAQYRPMDDYNQPQQSLMETDETGKVACDSCELRLYFTTYYGDSLVAMNARVRELDAQHVMEENQIYYSDLDAADYVASSPRVDVHTTYSIFDPANPQLSTTASAYYRSIAIRLPPAYGAEILRHYYTRPQDFSNAYEFIHQVCPGLYVENTGGIGCMLDVEFSTLDIYFTYHGTTAAGNDTTYVGLTRLAGTEEVLQNTTVDTQIPDGLMAESNPFTMIKSPAGIYTEITLPVLEIFSGEHANDTLNSAQLILDRYNTGEELYTDFTLSPPAKILMLPKSELQSFFEEGKLPDDQTSYMTSYSNGAYAFNNISRLIKTLYSRRNDGDPDWNKVLLVPVDASYTSVTSLYSTTDVLTRMSNALSLSSVRLSGASGTTPQVSCIYSHFE